MKWTQALKGTQEEKDSMKRPIFIKEIESIIINLPKHNSPGLNGFTGKFYQALRKKSYQSVQSLSEDEAEQIFLNSF